MCFQCFLLNIWTPEKYWVFLSGTVNQHRFLMWGIQTHYENLDKQKKIGGLYSAFRLRELCNDLCLFYIPGYPFTVFLFLLGFFFVMEAKYRISCYTYFLDTYTHRQDTYWQNFLLLRIQQIGCYRFEWIQMSCHQYRQL